MREFLPSQVAIIYASSAAYAGYTAARRCRPPRQTMTAIKPVQAAPSVAAPVSARRAVALSKAAGPTTVPEMRINDQPQLVKHVSAEVPFAGLPQGLAPQPVPAEFCPASKETKVPSQVHHLAMSLPYALPRDAVDCEPLNMIRMGSKSKKASATASCRSTRFAIYDEAGLS
jgi:hypothetical protein